MNSIYGFSFRIQSVFLGFFALHLLSDLIAAIINKRYLERKKTVVCVNNDSFSPP